MKPDMNQFRADHSAMRQAQRTADAKWAKDAYEAKGGDKAAYDFKPSFKGETYENQVRGKKNG
jgi:hypothetical protein